MLVRTAAVGILGEFGHGVGIVIQLFETTFEVVQLSSERFDALCFSVGQDGGREKMRRTFTTMSSDLRAPVVSTSK